MEPAKSPPAPRTALDERARALFDRVTVGIVTALPKELAAAKAMLDDPVEFSAGGDGAGRAYVLGEIPAKGGGTHAVALGLSANPRMLGFITEIEEVDLRAAETREGRSRRRGFISCSSTSGWCTSLPGRTRGARRLGSRWSSGGRLPGSSRCCSGGEPSGRSR